jgi:hypothetical protein
MEEVGRGGEKVIVMLEATNRLLAGHRSSVILGREGCKQRLMHLCWPVFICAWCSGLERDINVRCES